MADITDATLRAMAGWARHDADYRRSSGALDEARVKFLAQHPLPWTVGNTLIWDANHQLVDPARREVRELVVDLANSWHLAMQERRDA